MTQDGFKDLHFKLDDQDILIRMQPARSPEQLDRRCKLTSYRLSSKSSI